MPRLGLAALLLLRETSTSSASPESGAGNGAGCFMQPKASGWNYKFAPGNVFPTDAMHPHGLRLTDNSAQCCTLCQSLNNCTFFTYSAGGTAAKPTCYTSSKIGPGGCCFLKTAEGGAGAKGCPTCTSGSTKPLAPIPAPNVWHQWTRCEEGDVNALFQYKGVWHLMHQSSLRPHTAVSHSVSKDLLSWERVTDVLQSGATADEQCYDGSASLVTRAGVLSPVLQIDGGCGHKQPGSIGCMESAGNGSTGGVTAFPADLKDPKLENWTKLSGPTVWHGCDKSAGPSPIWKNSHSGLFECIAIHGSDEARFVATDDTLQSWKMADPAFITGHGGGGGLWHELPLNVVGTESVPRRPTHIMQVDAAMGDGKAEFIMGVYVPSIEKFQNATASIPVDHGHNVMYGQLSHSKADDGMAAPAGADARTIHVSWLAGRSQASTSGPDCATGGQLTSFRDLRFDPRLGTSGALVETPIAEYEKLRGEKKLGVSSLAVKAGAAGVVVKDLGAAGATMDIELEVSVPDKWEKGASVAIGVRCEKGVACKQGMVVTLTANGTSNGQRMVVASVFGENQATAFPLLKAEAAIPVRFMTDHRSTEVFVAGGRWVFSCGLAPAAASGAVIASSKVADVKLSAAGWVMQAPPAVVEW